MDVLALESAKAQWTRLKTLYMYTAVAVICTPTHNCKGQSLIHEAVCDQDQN